MDLLMEKHQVDLSELHCLQEKVLLKKINIPLGYSNGHFLVLLLLLLVVALLKELTSLYIWFYLSL